MSHKASLTTPPRSVGVYVLRFRMPWQQTNQRYVVLTSSAARARAERVRAKGGEAVVFRADVGEWGQQD